MSDMCKGRIWWNHSYHNCNKKAGPTGYCGTHDPVRQKARQDARDAKYRAKEEARQQILAEVEEKKHRSWLRGKLTLAYPEDRESIFETLTGEKW